MHNYNLTFADGKTSRCIVMEPAPTEKEDTDGMQMIFFDRLVSAERVVLPPPEKLPWQRDGDVWRLYRFELRRQGDGLFLLKWPSGDFAGDKDSVRLAALKNWRDGC
jgi:hypothetical protein